MMEKVSSSDSDMSMDSLNNSKRNKNNRKESNENVETLLLPFYEKEILITIPKSNKGQGSTVKKIQKIRTETHKNNFLINKNAIKSKRNNVTYLERFRQQFFGWEKNADPDIRSLSPEFGDTEQESISEATANQNSEFYNTESYNEIYYEKLLSEKFKDYMNLSIDDEISFREQKQSKSPSPVYENNLKSVSEVSHPRRASRRVTVQPLPSFKLGGLGADIEEIKPRLQRARSLQRYSDKVRMVNRLKIYKQTAKEDKEKKNDKRITPRGANEEDVDRKTSYLVNNLNKKKTKCNVKSGEVRKCSDYADRNDNKKEPIKIKNILTNKIGKLKKTNAIYGSKNVDNIFNNRNNNDNIKANNEHNLNAINKGVNTESKSLETGIPPLEISFLVNVGGGPKRSSKLKSLEEKHKMYQDRVRSFASGDRKD